MRLAGRRTADIEVRLEPPGAFVRGTGQDFRRSLWLAEVQFAEIEVFQESLGALAQGTCQDFRRSLQLAEVQFAEIELRVVQKSVRCQLMCSISLILE